MGNPGWNPRRSAMAPASQNGSERAKTSRQNRSGDRREAALVAMDPPPSS
jgi:hypothetical protein